MIGKGLLEVGNVRRKKIGLDIFNKNFTNYLLPFRKREIRVIRNNE